MRKELSKRLVEKYPQIFADINGDPRKTAMCFGFQCGDGWYKILDEACASIMLLDPPEEFKAVQVKEKYGGLRFYVTVASDEIYEIINNAEQESYRTCEICGEPGRTRGGVWITTLCDKCADRDKQ